jgi:hypothetical protein
MAKAKKAKRGRRAPATKRKTGRKAAKKPVRRASRRTGTATSASATRRIAALEAENRRLREELEALRAGRTETAAPAQPEPAGGEQPGERTPSLF